ncbi:hypothetical protein AGDE_17096 [Angomonas deanei]|nr:hypothetical protein AGDE_17096 [Angomonas deanei]|eukprot:EPY15489.1 hypothetical protein AGDE_17096 [Angomonas deanei]
MANSPYEIVGKEDAFIPEEEGKRDPNRYFLGPRQVQLHYRDGTRHPDDPSLFWQVVWDLTVESPYEEDVRRQLEEGEKGYASYTLEVKMQYCERFLYHCLEQCGAGGVLRLFPLRSNGKLSPQSVLVRPHYERTLQDYCAGEMRPEVLLEVLLSVLAGYVELYALRICHRNVRPSNILLQTVPIGEARGRVTELVWSDLKLAAAEGAPPPGTVGNLYHMAPEILKNPGEAVCSYRSDLYGVGLLFLTLWRGEAFEDKLRGFPHDDYTDYANARQRVIETELLHCEETDLKVVLTGLLSERDAEREEVWVRYCPGRPGRHPAAYQDFTLEEYMHRKTPEDRRTVEGRYFIYKLLQKYVWGGSVYRIRAGNVRVIQKKYHTSLFLCYMDTNDVIKLEEGSEGQPPLEDVLEDLDTLFLQVTLETADPADLPGDESRFSDLLRAGITSVEMLRERCFAQTRLRVVRNGRSLQPDRHLQQRQNLLTLVGFLEGIQCITQHPEFEDTHTADLETVLRQHYHGTCEKEVNEMHVSGMALDQQLAERLVRHREIASFDENPPSTTTAENGEESVFQRLERAIRTRRDALYQDYLNTAAPHVPSDVLTLTLLLGGLVVVPGDLLESGEDTLCRGRDLLADTGRDEHRLEVIYWENTFLQELLERDPQLGQQYNFF